MECLQCKLLPRGLCEEHYKEFKDTDHIWCKGSLRKPYLTDKATEDKTPVKN